METPSRTAVIRGALVAALLLGAAFPSLAADWPSADVSRPSARGWR